MKDKQLILPGFEKILKQKKKKKKKKVYLTPEECYEAVKGEGQ